jgi:lysophospholipase L1-like esterase
MPRKPVLYAILAALTAALAFTAAQTPASAQAPTRIMPLGDSITAGPGCWRALLWDRLQQTGFTNIDFVGTQPGGGCSVPHDGDHEGHGGFSATGIADQNQLPPWLDATDPDIVLMHLGTNDMWGGFIPIDTILAAYTKLVGQMRANNPSMTIVVAQIIPMDPSGCPTCAPGVVELNNAIPGWAAGLTTAQSPIVVVDQWTGFDTVADTNDGVHPIDSGFQKMADRWYPALAGLLDGVAPTPSPSTSSPTPPTSPPPAPGGCAASYQIVGQWQGGFQGAVNVTNIGTSPINGWTVRFRFANGQQVSQSWGGELSQAGPDVTVPNAAWNGTLAPGAAAEFGFIASWTGTNTVPTPTTCTPA